MRLDQNPFHILGASTRSDRQWIMNLVEERSLFLDPELCTRCRTDLITPRSRLQCEIAWLPGVSAERTEALLGEIMKGSVFEKLPSPLAQLNALVTHTVQRRDQLPEALLDNLLAIARECERVDAQEVRALINEDRRIAKFTVVDDVKDVEHALAEHTDAIGAELVRALRDRPAEDWLTIITQALERDTNDGTTPGSRLLHVLIDALAVDLEAKLEREKSRVDAAMQKVQDTAKAGNKTALDQAVDYLASALTRWDRYAQPLQLSARSRGRQHESSKNMADAVRSLAIELHNEHAAYESTWRIAELLGQVFAEDPRVVELATSDRTRLLELVAARTEAEEREVILKDLQPIKSPPALRTYNTIGTALYGQRDKDKATGTYVATLYFVILFIPLLPLSAYRVRNGENGGWYFVGKVPLSVGQRRYRKLVAAAAVLLFVIYGFNSESQRSGSYSHSGYSSAQTPTASPSATGNLSVSSAQYAPSSTSGKPGILTGIKLENAHSTLGAWIDAERARITATETDLQAKEARLESLDASVGRQKRLVESYVALATDDSLPPEIYDQYESDRQRYNSSVDEYNAALEDYRWAFSLYQRTLTAFNDSVRKYNGAL